MTNSANPINRKTGGLMKIGVARITPIAMVVIFLASCATGSGSREDLKSVAGLTSGDTVFYAFAGSDPTISIIDIDGKRVELPYGPIKLEPGTHSVTMNCEGSNNARSVTVSAGEIYQFNKIITPGIKGCAGSLSRVR